MQLSNSANTQLQNGRILYFDYLRVLAIFTTVAIHIISHVWYSADVHGFSWKVYNVFLSFFCWGVPVFTMISGALFLNPARTVEIPTLYRKNIAKLLVGFCFWSIAYAVVFDIRGKSIGKFLYSMFTGDFHMWFLFMIAVMYMLTPLLRKFTCDIHLTAYFLKLSFLLSFVIPQVLFILNVLDIPYFDNIIQGLSKSCGDMEAYFPHFYLFYFVGGYYLSVTELSPKARKVIYALGIAGYFFTVIATDLYSGFLGVENQSFHAKNGVNIALMTIAVFTFGKYELSRIHFSEKSTALICKLSGYAIGIYYVHLMIIKAAYGLFDLAEKGIHPFVTCIVFPPIAFVASVIATAVMRRIPLLKKVV